MQVTLLLMYFNECVVVLQSFEEFALLSTACVKQIWLKKSAASQASLDMISVECQTAWMNTVDAGCQTDAIEKVSQLSSHSLCQNADN